MLYESKIKVEKILNNGEQKEVKEHFILDAETFAEAEEITASQYPNNNFDVFAVFRSDIKEIVNQKEDDKPFFKATVCDITTDDLGKEKEIKYSVLVCATDIIDATNFMHEYLKQGYDMRLDGIRRVKIVDYIQSA